VKVPAPNEDEAFSCSVAFANATKSFNAVSYTEDALRYAVYLSNRYIPDRFLPDKAIDLIGRSGRARKIASSDGSGRSQRSTEACEVHHAPHGKRDRRATKFERKRRFYSEEERKEKETLRGLRDRYKLDDATTGIVSREDIEEVVSRWTGVAVTSIKEDEQQKLLRHRTGTSTSV